MDKDANGNVSRQECLRATLKMYELEDDAIERLLKVDKEEQDKIAAEKAKKRAEQAANEFDQSPEEKKRAEVEKMFNAFDSVEPDGELTVKEITDHMKKMDKENGTNTYSEKRVIEMFGKMDFNDDKTITKREFVGFMIDGGKEIMAEIKAQRLKEIEEQKAREENERKRKEQEKEKKRQAQLEKKKKEEAAKKLKNQQTFGQDEQMVNDGSTEQQLADLNRMNEQFLQNSVNNVSMSERLRQYNEMESKMLQLQQEMRLSGMNQDPYGMDMSMHSMYGQRF